MINVANPYFDNESAPASGAFSFMFFPFDSIKKTPNEDLCFVKSFLTFVYVKLLIQVMRDQGFEPWTP